MGEELKKISTRLIDMPCAASMCLLGDKFPNLKFQKVYVHYFFNLIYTHKKVF